VIRVREEKEDQASQCSFGTSGIINQRESVCCQGVRLVCAPSFLVLELGFVLATLEELVGSWVE
jgi:hypothetical protein